MSTHQCWIQSFLKSTPAFLVASTTRDSVVYTSGTKRHSDCAGGAGTEGGERRCHQRRAGWRMLRHSPCGEHPASCCRVVGRVLRHSAHSGRGRVAPVVVPRRQRKEWHVDVLVVDQRQQVRDAVQARHLLIVARKDEPGGPRAVRTPEHLVSGARVRRPLTAQRAHTQSEVASACSNRGCCAEICSAR